MTIFKDRLASSIRIKRKFAPSKERIKAVRNKAVALIFLLLTIGVILVIFQWLSM